MSPIVTHVMSILQSESPLLIREKNLNFFLTQCVTSLVSEALEEIDSQLITSMKAKGYHIDKRASRSVTFSFGTVDFERRKWVKAGEKPCYPLDECLGLEACQRFSTGLVNQLAQVATLGVYRKSAEAIELCCPFSVSHQTLHQLTRTLGSQIDQAQSADLGHESERDLNRKVPVLYVEGDAFCVKQKGGSLLYFHRFQVCEGRKKVGKKRRELQGYHDFVDVSRKKAFEQLKEYLSRTYDLSQVILVTNSDNGSGYGASQFRELCPTRHSVHEHFLDRYHLNRKLVERLNFVPKKFLKLFEQGLYGYDLDFLEVLYETAESFCERPQDTENLDKLKAYLSRNWSYLKPFDKRTRLVGLEAVIGTCESHHRPYTYRMKKQGKYWSLAGGQAMVKLISAKINHEIEKYSNFNFQAIQATEVPSLSLRELKKKNKEVISYNESFLQRIPSPKFQVNLNHWLDAKA